MEKENRSLEYKEIVNKTYLKTVSAFANYGDGTIIFGVTDDLRIVGIKDANKECINIENQINDSIKPKPDFSLKVNDDNTISLFVKKGSSTPYRYNGKCYRRSDSASIETDIVQENRLVLDGMNLKFEELQCNKEALSFEILKKETISKLNLSVFSIDTLKSLGLYTEKNGYNNAACLLSDENDFSGLDIVVFGDDDNEFRKRISLGGNSVLWQYSKALEIFEDEYIVERIEGGFRKKVERVPYEAYREAIANAIIHRAWDVRANTKVEMHKNKIIVSSPGGLLPEMGKEDYLMGSFSYLRNPILATVFLRLGIVEIFATGIKRINESYRNRALKPSFTISDNAITISLPADRQIDLSENEALVMNIMVMDLTYSRNELEGLSGLSKDTLIRALNSLIEKGLLNKTGSGRNLKYYRP